MHGPKCRRSGRFRWMVQCACGIAVSLVCAARPACAQEPPPRIGPFVLDFHGVVPRFGGDPQLAGSRGLSPAELPGSGLGVSAAAHFYLLKIASVTVGLGGEVIIARSSTSPDTSVTTTSTLRPVTEIFKEISPQLSLNFGNGHGWSYLSAGIGQAIWSIVPEGRTPLAADEDVIRTLNYGGGARWFAKNHLAFSLDVRLYGIPAGTDQAGLPGSPRTLLLVIGAGISLK
jgi:hypothetical protein